MRLLLFIICFPVLGFGQLNMTELGYLDLVDTHSVQLNDIWGYEDEDGNEYAIVGTTGGVSIVDVTDPANPTEIEWIDGMYSIWRDIKTSGDYAYVTTEAEEGLLVIDLSPLPASTSLPYTHYTGPVGNEWYTAHNLYEDNGYVYIFGAGRGNGGVIILDVTTDPMNPIEVGTFDNWYAHDGFVLNDTAYFAHINDGFFSICDVTNKSAPVFINSFTTSSVFTHNIWTTDDGNYAFTTDEVSGGYLDSYDVSDPMNIQFLDQIQSSPGQGIVPHNAHVLGDYVITSYYTDGVTIHDVTHPYNLIEVGNFDTSPLATPNTSGCWGVYPYFTSGNMVASDREEGLFVLSANMHQGAYLEGNVTEFGTSNPINNVSVSILGETIQDGSDVLGDYATGVEATGTYDVEYFKILYFPETLSVNLTEGVITNQDVVLTKIPQYQVHVTVLDAITLNPIENANVVLNHTFISHDGVTDVNGEVVLDVYYEDNYEAVAGKWGYLADCFSDTLLNSTNDSIVLYLNEGIYDDFTFDFGWNVFSDAFKGEWVREVPVGVMVGNTIENPFTDGLFDCGQLAYVTGNGSTSANTDEVDAGQTTLISPTFDLTAYTDPHINFEAFFFNMHGPQAPDDTLKISLFNGSTLIDIAKLHKDNTLMGYWESYSIPIAGQIPLTSTMQLILNISDFPLTVNVTEAAFDHFRITDFSMASVEEETNQISVFPNPFNGSIQISGIVNGEIEILDLSGRIIEQMPMADEVDLSHLESGMYLIVLKDISGNIVEIARQIKQ